MFRALCPTACAAAKVGYAVFSNPAAPSTIPEQRVIRQCQSVVWGHAARELSNIMNSKIRILLAGAAGALGCAFATTSFADVAASGDTAVQGPAPSPSFVWMAGHWDSDAGQWKWVAAHWEQPPTPSAAWIGGHWISQSGKWVWVNGAWNVADTPQPQSGPPQPPGQGLQNSVTAVGSAQVPYSPAPSPYVDGEDGPGGVSRTVDEGAVVTDYGPATYYSAYPDYGYAYGYGYGYPLLWDGAILGFGFGPRFYGGGHYGYVRGGGHYARGGGSFTGHVGGHGH